VTREFDSRSLRTRLLAPPHSSQGKLLATLVSLGKARELKGGRFLPA
jgi:hypothetical protein